MSSVVGALDIEIAIVGPAQAAGAANLRLATRPLGLSLGDRFCLALGLERNLPVITADRAWAGLDLGVEIQLIR